MKSPVPARVAPVILLLALPLAPGSMAAVSGEAAQALPPLAVYGQLPSLDDPVISPLGNRLAYIMRDGDRRSIQVFDLTKNKPVAAAALGDMKVRGLRWYDDDRLLILYSATSNPPIGVFGPRQEWLMLANWDLATGRMGMVSINDADHQTMDVVTGSIAVRTVNGQPKLFVSGLYLDGEQFMPGLFEVDLGRDETRLIAEGNTHGSDWAVDAQGRIAAAFDYHVAGNAEGQWVLRLRRGDWLRQAAAGKAVYDSPYIVGFSYDDKSLLVAFDTPDGWIWKPLNLADDTWGAPLGAGETFYDVIRDRLTGQVVGGLEDSLSPRQVFFDPALQSRWSALMGAYSGERVDLISYSDDFTKFMIRVLGPRDGYRYVLIDWRTSDSAPLGDIYSGLSTFATVRPIQYKAADGLPISGFLTLPPGKPPKQLSLIVMPHGGPAATDDGSFDWWAQALASRGYAVLQVNYRGSDTTPSLLRAGYGEWGRKMQTDLSDGVGYLVAQGIVDPKRVCIVGASYGGYAALAGVSLQTGIYRCAVSVAGVGDLAAFLRWTSSQMSAADNEFTRYWDRFLGVTGADDPLLGTISPIDHVAAITVPVLLIHGRDDTVVPYAQSKEMAKALKRAGKSVQLVSLPHEDHWLSHSATREEMLEDVVSFLEQQDPPG